MISAGKPSSCESCRLSLLGTGFVRPDGPTASGLLILGEAAGETEAKRGVPFVGSAGFLLDRLLELAGTTRSSYRVANVVWCRPPNNELIGAPYEMDAVTSCSRYLREELQHSKPKVVLALGNTALRRTTGVTGISRYRGFPMHGIGDFTGMIVVPTYHPAFLLPRAQQKDTVKLTGVVILDVKKALDILQHGLQVLRTDYLLDPSVSRAQEFCAEYEAALRNDPETTLAWDIETLGKLKARDESEQEEFDTTIMRMSFAFRPGYAMSIPHTPEYRPIIRRLLENPDGPKVGWNCYAFDIPIISVNGYTVLGPSYDGMWGWHLFQSDLPRGLESVTSQYAYDIQPWKHLADEVGQAARYSAIDADATIRCWQGIARDLRARALWDLYQRHVVKLEQVLYRAGRIHGVPIDLTAQAVLREKLIDEQARLLRAAQTVVPEKLKAKKLYLRPPKTKGPLVEVPDTREVNACATCGLQAVTKLHLRKCPGPIIRKTIPATKFRWTPDYEQLRGAELEAAVNETGFNPNSTDQLLRYAHMFDHPTGYNYRTAGEQMDKQVLRRLIKKYGHKHPIYGISAEIKQVSKTLGTYVDGFAPDAQGLIYTSYTYAPSTGRLSSRNVNLQNVSRRSDNKYAGDVRATVVPGAGYAFVEADSSAVEAVMTGYFMEDPDYMAAARAGIHDKVACHKLGIPFDPALTKERRKDPTYEEMREICKRVVHLSNYGGTPKMMVLAAPEVFKTERLATELQMAYFEACPKLEGWHHAVRRLAHRQKYLQNPWGYRHYFYSVFVKSYPSGSIVLGPDGKRVVAFLPQSSAGAFMKDSLLLLSESEWVDYTPANLYIHDSICLRVPTPLVDRAADFLCELLTRPIPEMGGLRIGCEVKLGATNWRDTTTIRKINV